MYTAKTFFLIATACAVSACAHDRSAVPLPDYGAVEAWSFLDRAIGERQFVMLGESIHLTAEFPRTRLPVVRRLHEELGFDVIAFEGSMIDAWVAADILLRAENPDELTLRNAAGTAWFDIWCTADMLEVMKYIASTKNTPRPLYLASMDIQPGLGDTEKKRKMHETFAARVFEYSGRAGDAQKIALALEGTRKCEPIQAEDARAAVDELETAIRAADAKVRALSPMHADALSLIPSMLRQRLIHCTSFVKDGEEDWGIYKEERDRYQAENMIAFQEKVSRSGKVISWAHHSHTSYLGTEGGRSIGSELKKSRPGQVYSLGMFAASGRCGIIEDGASANQFTVELPAWNGEPKYSGMSALVGLERAPAGYFLDLERARGDARMGFLSEEHVYFTELGPTRLVLDREFDGLILVPEISEPKMEPM